MVKPSTPCFDSPRATSSSSSTTPVGPRSNRQGIANSYYRKSTIILPDVPKLVHRTPAIHLYAAHPLTSTQDTIVDKAYN